MKRLITAVILPFFCLALAVSSAVYTDRTLTKSINEIERMEDENEFELSRAQNLFGEWKKDKKLLAILLKHEDVDEIEMNLNGIVYAAKTQSEAIITIATIKNKNFLLIFLSCLLCQPLFPKQQFGNNIYFNKISCKVNKNTLIRVI